VQDIGIYGAAVPLHNAGSSVCLRRVEHRVRYFLDPPRSIVGTASGRNVSHRNSSRQVCIKLTQYLLTAVSSCLAFTQVREF
jgi:hypothetical protein